MGVLLDQQLGPGGEVVGDQDGGVLVAEPADGELADVARERMELRAGMSRVPG
jgi:regulator of RNase E activity RraA